MKRATLFLTAVLAGTLSVMAQNVKEPDSDTVISMKEFSIFSNCFKDIDTNGDGIVDAAEASAATILVLDRGGRSNIINNYDFLKHFPNLKAFSVGTTTAEVIDLHYLGKLENLNLTNALFLQKIILAQGCQPEIINPQGKARIDIEYYVEDETIRMLLEEYS